MIGKIDVPRWGEAVMQDDGTWTAADESLAMKLNGSFPAAAGISVLPFGHGAVIEAAHFFGVQPVFGKPRKPPPDGVVS